MNKLMLLTLMMVAPALCGGGPDQGYKFRVLVKTGDRIDGRTITDIYDDVTLNDQGEIGFVGAFTTTGRDDRHGVFTSRRAVIDNLTHPGFTYNLVGNDRLHINRDGDVIFVGSMWSGSPTIPIRSVFLNDRVIFDGNTPRPPWADASEPAVHPYLNDSGRITFVLKGAVCSLNRETGELRREMPETIDGKDVYIASPYDMNESGEFVFTSSWKVPRVPTLTMFATQPRIMGVFTKDRLVRQMNEPFATSSWTPKINRKGQICYFEGSGDVLTNNHQTFSVFIDGQAVPGLSIEALGGNENELLFNDSGTISVRDPYTWDPIVVRGGVVQPLFGSLMTNQAFWQSLTDVPLRKLDGYSRVIRKCALNDRDEIACVVRLSAESGAQAGIVKLVLLATPSDVADAPEMVTGNPPVAGQQASEMPCKQDLGDRLRNGAGAAVDAVRTIRGGQIPKIPWPRKKTRAATASCPEPKGIVSTPRMRLAHVVLRDGSALDGEFLGFKGTTVELKVGNQVRQINVTEITKLELPK